MSRIFIAMPQYRPLSKRADKRLADLFEIENWKPTGVHPRVYGSINNLTKTKHQFLFHALRNDGLIERSQCTLFAQWLRYWNDGDKYDYYLRLDEDIEFHYSAIQSMIDADKPIIGGAYAYKAKEGLKAQKSVCKYLPGEAPDEKGILKILWLNGGFQFFRSDALFKLMEAYPQLRYERMPESGCNATESYALWTSMVKTLEVNGEKGMTILLSEDYGICQRARDIGMDSYLDLKVDLCHWDTEIPEDDEENIQAIGYRIGREPVIVTREEKPWRKISTETTLNAG